MSELKKNKRSREVDRMSLMAMITVHQQSRPEGAGQY